MKKPLVSVIIPVYNSAEYIECAIESVLKQNVPLEIIIINDNSTDNLEQIIEKYILLDNVIYIKNDSNRGVAYSRNIGVGYAKGKYIAYLDADDWWMPDKLRKQIKLMHKKQCVLCYTGRKIVNESGAERCRFIHVKNTVDYNGLLYHNCIACSSVVLEKKVALEYPMNYSYLHEDYITWLSILKKYKRAYGLDEPLLVYRLSKNGKSRNKIKSARMTYGVYRIMEIGKMKAFLLMCSHLLHSLLSYHKKGILMK